MSEPPKADGVTESARLDTDATHSGAFELHVAEPGRPERAWRATGRGFAIGSHPSNELVLKDPTVSRFHAEVGVRQGLVTIRDLDSRNGCFVDGVRVREAYVRAGDAVHIGRVLLRFGADPGADAAISSASDSFGGLVGISPAMRAVFAILERAAQSDATVLLEGETGTGKGEAALALHKAGARAGQPFGVVDCGSIPDKLFESELFGSERGAFTGADVQRVGAFEAADGGTVFLDEIGELPLEVQPKLLRVLEERQIRRLGKAQMHPVDVRVIAATSRDLRAAVNDGSFRADLYYRLAVVRARLPALRERVEDLPMVVARLVASLGATPEQAAELSSPRFLAGLGHQAWPGNVRELRNYLERWLVLEQQPDVVEAWGGAAAAVNGEPGKFQESRSRVLASFERAYLTALLAKHEGKVSAAAETAGVSRVYLYRLLQRYRLLG